MGWQFVAERIAIEHAIAFNGDGAIVQATVEGRGWGLNLTPTEMTFSLTVDEARELHALVQRAARRTIEDLSAATADRVGVT